MGGGGGGSSSQTTTTEQRDERVAASDNAIVVQLDANSQLTLSDPLIAAEIPDLIRNLLDAGGDAFNESLAFVQQGNEKSIGLIEQALKQNQSEDRQNFADLLKWGAVIAVAAVVSGGIKWK